MPDSSSTASWRHAAAPDDAQTRVLLAMLHRARSCGDRAEAERVWKLLVVSELERVRGIARAFRSEVLPGARIPAADIDDVAHEVFVRLHDKVGTLRGKSVGELRSFVRTATGYACKDYVDRHVRDDRRRRGSLDEVGGGGASPTDRALAALAERLAAEDDEALIAREIVHPALGMVDDDKRAVLVLDHLGVPVAEIVERLGLSRDAVYQRRRRGLLQLGAAIDELTREDGAL